MIYSTFIGGLSSDVCFSATLDNSNYLYVTGWTHASNFPIIAGAFQSFYSGNVDVFISKVELIPCLIVTLPISNSPLCEGQTLNLTVTPTAGATYNWSGPNGFTSVLQNPNIANVSMAANGVYTITVTSANGCTNSDTVNVLINPLPSVVANNDTTICEGQTLDLTVTPTAGATYNWTGPNGFTSPLQNPSIANVTLAATGVYSITIIDVNGCSNSDTTNVLINPLPTAIANNDTTLCEGQTLDLTVTPTAGATYNWSGPNGFTSPLQNPSIANVTLAATGVYTITIIDVNGCSNSDTTNVLINPLPTVIANNDTTLCEEQTLSLNVNAVGGAAYNWTGPNGFTSALQNPSIVNVTMAANGVYTIAIYDANGCSNSDTTNVLINALPTVISNNDTTLCEGQTLNLTVTPTVGAAYSWTGPNGFTSALQNPSITNVTIATNGVYTITAIDVNGCSNSDTTNVLINALPTVISNNDTTLCEGQTLSLTVNATAGATYNWTGPNGFSSAIQNPFIVNVTLAATGTYTVVVVDTNGCSKSDTTYVKVVNCTGIDDYTLMNSIFIYPNPNNGTFTLETSRPGTFELFDMAGRIIHTYEVKSSPYTITEKLSSGMYFIREKDSGASIRNRVAQKVIIE
ncbi:MAG: T9SS type A sorting domain-containing protein [Bacteroidetes bacterium]|nr:T9SS type A sorting domain-containing protein [Bacteroidota bacterium]